MARRRGRGGYQRPNSPAAVSGPGAASQRTDGGPTLEYSGLGYGENKAVNDQAASAPMGGPPGAGGPPAGGGGGGGQRPRVFGPTERPGEPMTSGVDAGPGKGRPATPPLPNDTDAMIRAVIAEYPELAERLIHLVKG